MRKVTKISDVLSFLKTIQEEFGDLVITMNTEFNYGNPEDDPVIFGDDDVYLKILERDTEEKKQEKVLSIQNVEHIK